MSNSAEDFFLFSADEMLTALQGQIDLDTNRVVGFYGEVGASMPLGVGGEGLYFRGVDTQTGEIVEAYYAGATLGAGATPATVGAGAFGFTGPPSSLAGWSVGVQASSVITGGVSVAADGSILHFYGVNTSLGVNATGGFTYSVTVGGDNIYWFGEVNQIPSFSDLPQVLAVLDSLPSAGNPDFRTVNYVTPIDGSQYSLRQSIVKLGDALQVNTYVVDASGNVINNDEARAILAEYGSLRQQAFSDEIWARQFYASNEMADGTPRAGRTVSDFYEEIQDCFVAGTLVDMWPLDSSGQPMQNDQLDQDAVRAQLWKKPIERIEKTDIVVSFDRSGQLVPGHVTRTFQKQVNIVLDFHGVGVTPGHVFFRPDSPLSHKFETLIDILVNDGVVEHQDGSLIRAATGLPIDDPRDGFVWAITGDQNEDGNFVVKTKGRIRLGTRFMLDDGKTLCVADLIAAQNGTVTADGLICTDTMASPAPLVWAYGDKLPRPEDYILKRSNTTLLDIYKAAEWDDRIPYSVPSTAH